MAFSTSITPEEASISLHFNALKPNQGTVTLGSLAKHEESAHDTPP